MNKQIKLLQKYIQKEYGLKWFSIKENDTLINISERIAIKTENCTVDEAYKKWIINPSLHLPGWICNFLILDFFKKGKPESTIKDLIGV
jgi:hypothetical protein